MSVLQQLFLATFKAAASPPPPPPATVAEYFYTGADQTFTVPAEITEITYKSWGAGGGGGNYGNGGGGAGFATNTISVTPGETFNIIVGEGGKGTATYGSITQRLATYGRGGASGSRNGASGGGMTALYRGDLFDSNVSLLLHFNGSNGSTTFTDDSLNVKIVTGAGTASISTTQSKFGGSSLSLNGSSYLSVPDSSDFDLGTSFTVEGWIYFNNLNDAALVGGSATGSMDFAFIGNEIRIGRINTNWDSSAPFVRSTGTWYHVAWCRSNSTLRFFVNGTQVGSSANNTITYVINGGNLIVGGSTTGDRLLNGFIDDLRITRGIARYVTNFTLPAAEFADPLDPSYYNVSLLLHMNGTNGSTTFTDNSSVPKTITANGGAQISTAQSKFGGSSLFTGTSGNNFLQTPASNDFIFGTGNFTIEGWFLPSGAGDERTFYIHGINTIGGLTLFVGTGGARFRANGTTDLVAGSSITTWTHIAFVRSGNTRYIFINGALSNSDSLSFNVSDDVVTDIGASSQNASDSFKYYGYIDDLRITKGVARYTAAFNPPNREFANSSALISVAAGGGGGASSDSNRGHFGGAGGGLTGTNGSGQHGVGSGGTQSAGGAGGTATASGVAGTLLTGGDGASYGGSGGGGGGGGAGYYGGGGGGDQSSQSAGGGGGGSSYVILNGSTTSGSGTTPGQNTDTNYYAGAGVGGAGASSNGAGSDGGNGYMHISWVVTPPVTTVFDFTGASEAFVVPTGVTSITAKLWGGAGGGQLGGAGTNGGGGGYSTATLSVTPGETLDIYVGGGGLRGGTVRNGGSGGGSSAIVRAGTPLIIAGGGGGGSSYSAGAGGGAVGENGLSGGSGSVATGGTQSSSGVGFTGGRNIGNSGSGFNGGNGHTTSSGTTTWGHGIGGWGGYNAADVGGGGGGGGYYGGGGGGVNNFGSGTSGGGGSSFVPVGGTTLSGSGSNPGNSSDADRGTAGQGGLSLNGNPGRVVIIY